MKCGVIVFPGSNCDHDTWYVLNTLYGLETKMLWHKDPDLKGCDLIFIPGGFSYGDYLRSGAIARFSPVMESVARHASDGGFVMGICNGFQVLTEARLLPGTLQHNANQRFTCKHTHIKAATANSALTSAIPEDKVLRIPVAHGEGRYFADESTINALKENDQIVFQYCNEAGELDPLANPNGSIMNIAGICNEGRNVYGMMPHPERASDPTLGATDGRFIFDSILQHFGVNA